MPVTVTTPGLGAAFATRAEWSKVLQSHPDVMSKLAAAAGLAHMDAKNYRAAARKFTEVCLGYIRRMRSCCLALGKNALASPL